MEAIELGLREKNNGERRAALIAAAYALFAQKGFAGTTMDDVAEKAGLSRRTAFRYFTSKEDLVFPHQAARLVHLRSLLVARSGETAFETVRRACLAMARIYEDDRANMLAQFRIVEREPSLLGTELELDRQSEDAIAEAFLRAERDTGRGKRRARVRAAAVVGVVRATLREWLEGGASGDLARLGRETLGDLERGFGIEE